MATQNFFYPPSSSGSSSNASVGPNNTPIPADSTLIGGKDGAGDLIPVSVDSSGNVNVNVSSSVLPTGGATAANQVIENASLASIDGKIVHVDTGNVTVVASALPTGAATEATLSSLNGKVVHVDTGAVVVSSSALPTGAATAANQSTEIASLSSIDGKLNSLGQKTMANSMPVVIASDQSSLPVTVSSSSSVKIAGKSAVDKARHDYSTGNVTTSAYTQLIASTAATASEIFIFDSSGQTLVLAFGGSGSEVDQIYIVPGGNGTVPLSVPASTRLSIKAVSATANAGEIDINLLG